MEPVEQVFGFGVEIKLQAAHGLAAVGDKGDLLVHLHALAFEHLEKAPLGLVVIGLHQAKALAAAFFRNGFAHDHFEVRLLVIPLPEVAAINPDGERGRRPRQSGPFPRTPVDKGTLLFAEPGLGPFCHTPQMVVHAGGADMGTGWQYVTKKLCGKFKGDQ